MTVSVVIGLKAWRLVAIYLCLKGIACFCLFSFIFTHVIVQVYFVFLFLQILSIINWQHNSSYFLNRPVPQATAVGGWTEPIQIIFAEFPRWSIYSVNFMTKTASKATFDLSKVTINWYSNLMNFLCGFCCGAVWCSALIFVEITDIGYRCIYCMLDTVY